ncbi:hypothetical protein PQR75_06520 [Paraburkholderia fungorum]|uniref:hypothetical protein n=1 Tax=Paraburkholderia fungorum TaxID=134537 RepID=UPI0038BB45F1
MNAIVIQFPAPRQPAPQTVEDLMPEETTRAEQGGCNENSTFPRQYAICEDYL